MKLFQRHSSSPGRDRRASDRGASSVELALVIPVLMLLVIGSLDLGRAVWARNSMANAVRDVARWASVRSRESKDPATAGSVEDRVKRIAVGLDPNKLQITTTWTPANIRDATVRIDAVYLYEPATPIPGVGAISLTTSSRSRVSY